jgi:hypothetical protein
MMRRMPRWVVPVGLGVGLAFYVALLELGAEFVLVPPESVHDFWYGPGPLLIGACASVALGVLARHLAVLALALIPIAVQSSLDAVGFVRPWHEVSPTINPGWPLTLLIALTLSLGLVAGTVRDARRRAFASASR